MRKLVLNVEKLDVETFQPAPQAPEPRGTVFGRASDIPCTNSFTCWATCVSEVVHCFPTAETC